MTTKSKQMTKEEADARLMTAIFGESHVFTAEQIDAAAEEKSECFPWGYKEYRKVFGQWELSHILVTDEVNRLSYKVYPDSRPSEIIHWAC